MSTAPRPVMERLVEKVSINPETGCWDWAAYITPEGYGSFFYRGRRNGLAHRAAYTETVGEIPEGMHIDHLCRNRACCNPSHLEVVQPRVNYLRGVGPTAVNAEKSECSRGHAFDEANTYWRPKGDGRDCRECRRSHGRARRSRAMAVAS